MEARFICTDLVVEHSEELTPLADELDRVGLFVHLTRSDALCRLMAETNTDGSASESTMGLIEACEGLSEESRALLDRANDRWLDLGFRSGREPFQLRERLAPDLLRRAANLGLGIKVTVYDARA